MEFTPNFEQNERTHLHFTFGSFFQYFSVKSEVLFSEASVDDKRSAHNAPRSLLKKCTREYTKEWRKPKKNI